MKPCPLCGLRHGSKTGPKVHKTERGLCSIVDCDNPRDGTHRYCRRCFAQYQKGHFRGVAVARTARLKKLEAYIGACDAVLDRLFRRDRGDTIAWAQESIERLRTERDQ